MNNKRGLSIIISAMIMILLVIVAVGTIWVTVKNLVEEKIEETESCFGIFGEVSINNQYTCYNSSSDEVQFSINIGDIDVDKILVLISSVQSSESIEIYNGAIYSHVKDYGDNYNDSINLPGKNAGLTYVASGFSNKPDLIEISPVINENVCGISDSLSEIDNCLLLV